MQNFIKQVWKTYFYIIKNNFDEAGFKSSSEWLEEKNKKIQKELGSFYGTINDNGLKNEFRDFISKINSWNDDYFKSKNWEESMFEYDKKFIIWEFEKTYKNKDSIRNNYINDIINLVTERRKTIIKLDWEAKKEYSILTEEWRNSEEYDSLISDFNKWNKNYNDLLCLSRDSRIKLCTKWNIDIIDVKDWFLKHLTFDFKFWWEKINEEIYLKTTAWQLLPPEIREVVCNWVVYKRSWLYGEFFTETNDRLIIHDETSISISKLDSKEDIQKEEEKIKKNIPTDLSKKHPDKTDISLLQRIYTEASLRNIDTDFAINLYYDLLIKEDIENIKLKLETFLVDFDRVRWMTYNFSEKNWDYSKEFKLSLLVRNYWNNDNLKDKAKKFWIKDNELDNYKKIWAYWVSWIKNIDLKNLPSWVKWLLELISIAEWTKSNYNAIYWNANQSSVKYTEMSIREVLESQKIHWQKTGSSAFWRYQIMQNTLKWLVKNGVVSLDDKFSEENQDKMAISLLNQRWLYSYLKWNMTDSSFQLSLSKEWASLPKDRSWKWYYDWDHMWNKALITSNILLKTLEKIKQA